MNIDDDSHDPLADQLRREALNEWPAFSPELHDQILNRLRDERHTISAARVPRFHRPLLLAIAAVLTLAGGMALVWLNRATPTSTPIPPTIITQNDSPDPIAPPITSHRPLAMSANVGGLLSATLWPPQVTLHLPIDEPLTERPPEPPIKPPSPPPLVPGSPEWLLAGLQQPTLNAKTALTDLIPPEFQRLFDMATRER